MSYIPHIYFVIVWIICMILWYRMSSILRRKNYPIDHAFMPINYLSFSDLIKKEPNLQLKKKYRYLKHSLQILSFGSFAGYFILQRFL
jgi:hypothetical protein